MHTKPRANSTPECPECGRSVEGCAGREEWCGVTVHDDCRDAHMAHCGECQVADEDDRGRHCVSAPGEGKRATAREIARARAEYQDIDIEIDDDAKVSRAEDGSGAWVAAWAWLPTINQGEGNAATPQHL